MIDLTNPTIAGAPTSSPNGNGWYNASVTIHWTCGDALSGVATCPADQSISGEGTNQTVNGAASDAAGNSATATSSPAVNIDKTAPTVTYSGNAGTYIIDQTVNITCSASDALSGVASTTCQTISGPAYSFALGVNTFSATATDNAGNVGIGSTTFTVGVTPDSLCALTKQFVSNRRDASRLCSPLTGVKWAEAMGSQQLKASFVSSYIYLVNLLRGLSHQQKAILIQLAQAL